MTEEVIARLQQFASLNVPSIRSSMKFKGSQLSYAEIARELGAKALVDASIQYVNNRVRVIARLVDPPTDRTLWSETYDGSVEDILDLQSKIAQAVVREVRVKVSQDEQSRLSRPSRKVNPQAYELYLSALQDFHLFTTSFTMALWDSSMAKLQRAIDIEPDNALYYASLASGYSQVIDASLVPFPEAFPKMKTAAETAVKLDPELAESQIAAAQVDYWQYNFEGALVRTSRALELSPGNSQASRLRGAILTILGRYEEALEIYRHANELDPIAYKTGGFNVGFCYFFMRRYDDAIAYLQQWLRQNPKSESGNAYLSCAFSVKGMHAEALALCDSAPYSGTMNRPFFLAKAGKRDLAIKAYEQNVSMINSYSKADFFALIGQKDSAFYWLQRFYREPTGEILWLPHDPFLDNLRDDPRFAELLKAVHLDGRTR
jgi:tetratricopeptide (TPR) repeat protein